MTYRVSVCGTISLHVIHIHTNLEQYLNKFSVPILADGFEQRLPLSKVHDEHPFRLSQHRALVTTIALAEHRRRYTGAYLVFCDVQPSLEQCLNYLDRIRPNCFLKML